MEQELNTLREKFVQDLFVSQGLGAVIDEAHYGYAKCSMEIEPRHCNALGIPMGGTIFTLADFAFAVASNQRGRAVVTQASQITFLKSARGKHLTANGSAFTRSTSPMSWGPRWPSSPSMAMWSKIQRKQNTTHKQRNNRRPLSGAFFGKEGGIFCAKDLTEL